MNIITVLSSLQRVGLFKILSLLPPPLPVTCTARVSHDSASLIILIIIYIGARKSEKLWVFSFCVCVCVCVLLQNAGCCCFFKCTLKIGRRFEFFKRSSRKEFIYWGVFHQNQTLFSGIQLHYSKSCFKKLISNLYFFFCTGKYIYISPKLFHILFMVVNV